MSSDGSVTRWIDQIQGGDPQAAQQLWERYFRRLVGLARKKLQREPRLINDEEDVALSAFDSFIRNAEQGRFPQLADRDGLWRLLVVLTARKAAHLVRDQARLKRAPAEGEAEEYALLGEVLSHEPSPDFAAEVAEQCRSLLARLGDRELESLAVWRMEGYSVKEIARRLDCAPRSVKRKLQLIRDAWEEVRP